MDNDITRNPGDWQGQAQQAVKDKAEEMRETVEEKSRTIKQKAREWTDKARHQARDAGARADLYVHQYAWTTVALTAVVAGAVGYMLGSRRA